MDMPKIIIKLFIFNYNKELSEVLYSKLLKKVQTKFPKVSIKLKKAFKYYKQFVYRPEITECQFYIYNDEFIKVSDIGNLFDTKWDPSNAIHSFFRDGIKCEYVYEDLLWNRMSGGKPFLNKNVFFTLIKNNELDLDLDYYSELDLKAKLNREKPKKDDFFMIDFILNVINYDLDLKNILLNKVRNITYKCDPKGYTHFFSAVRLEEDPEAMYVAFELYFPGKSPATVKNIIELVNVKRFEYRPPDEEDWGEEAIWSDFEHGGIFLDENVKWANIESLKDWDVDYNI